MREADRQPHQRPHTEIGEGFGFERVADSSGSPFAGPILLERVGDLSGNEDADEATFAALCEESVLLPPESVPDDVRRHLCRDVGPTPFANGGDMLLVMHAAQSMARGPLPDVP